MLDKNKKHQFIEIAKQKHKVTWSEIEDFFGPDITESKDFDYLLYKLDEENVKVINDSFDSALQARHVEENSNSKKKIIVKVKKSAAEIQLESETIKLKQLLSFARDNDNKLTYGDIQTILGLERIITESEKFKKTIDELKKSNIEIENAEYDDNGKLIFKYSYDDSLFESYINFEHPDLVSLRKEVGKYNAQETEKYNKTFKEYLVKAYLELGYNKLSICKTYGISDEALNDWIFTHNNRYDPILPEKDGKYTFYPFGLKERGRKLFREEKKTYEEIALILKVYPSTVKRWVTRISETDIRNSAYEAEKIMNIKQIIHVREVSRDLPKINSIEMTSLKEKLESITLQQLKTSFPDFYEVNMTKEDSDLPAPLNLNNEFVSISNNYITEEFYNTILPYRKMSDNKYATPSTILEAMIFCNQLSKICGLDTCYRTSNLDIKLEDLLYITEPVDIKYIFCDTSKNGFRILSFDEYKYICRKIIHENQKDDVKKYPLLEDKFYEKFSHLLTDSEYTLSINYKKYLSFVFKSHPVLEPSDRPAFLLYNKENSTDLYSYSEEINLLDEITNNDYKFMICSIQK